MDHLELLMRMYDARECAVHETALRELTHLDERTFARCIADLVASSLVRAVDPDAYQFAGRGAEVQADVELMAQLYHQRPVTLVRFVYEQPSRQSSKSIGASSNPSS